MLNRVLVLDASGKGAQAAIFDGPKCLATGSLTGEPGLPARLAPMVAELIEQAGAPEAIGVVTGPGGFTGLRASLALAAGLGAGWSVPVYGLDIAQVLAVSLPDLEGRPLWTALHARRDRIFLQRGDVFEAFDKAALPKPTGPVAAAGDAAIWLAASLASVGANVMLTGARAPHLMELARLTLALARSGATPAPLLPAYVDPPEAALPRGGLRPAPA